MSVLPSSNAGNVTRFIVFCASLLDFGQGCWMLLLNHCAEHVSDTKSYAIVSSKGVLTGIVKVGSIVGSLVCVGSGKGDGVLVGANMTFTCTHI